MLRKAKGFTLVELLVVVSIIALLMALLVPALGRARQQARNAATKSALNAVSTGLEQFRGEYGHYPSSKRVLGEVAEVFPGEQQFPMATDNGAHHLAAALVGLDLQGYDETGAYDPARPTGSGFLDLEKIGLVSLRIEKSRIEAAGKTWDQDAARSAFAGHDIDVDARRVWLNLNPMLVDNISSPAKSRPILYWRANRRGRTVRYIYNRDDNADILDEYVAPGKGNRYTVVQNGKLVHGDDGGLKHPDLRGALDPDADPPDGGADPFDVRNYFAPTPSTAGTFEYHAWNPATSASAWSSPDGPNFTPPQPREPYGKPYNPDSFLLICAGADGEYGTKDDIGNFEQQPKPE